MKNIANKLDIIIIFLLLIACIYGAYSIFDSYISNFGVIESIKAFFPIVLFTIIYIYCRKRIQGTEFIISIYFLVRYTIFMPKGFNIFSILLSQLKVSFKFDFSFLSSISMVMSIIYILLMILPLIQFIYLKKNRLAPYNE